jgi:quinol-cytochrome oxidoreductase complex cytochrome b subunit
MRRERWTAERLVTSRFGTLGDLATAAFVVAAASGAVVAVPYDAGDGYRSIAAILLANPAASFFRNAHYWAGQIGFVLTLLHVWDHLGARTEGRVSVGVWLRLTATVPLLAFIMLSGFMLRADPEARQALRILTEAIAQVPVVGSLLTTLVFGPSERLGLVYLQHAATATIVVWLFAIEHARRVWPRVPAFVAVSLLTAGLSMVLTPGLHDGLDPIVKGPWYFLGLQELLHWTPWPRLVVLAGAAIVAALFAVRLVGPRRAAAIKGALLALVLAYAGLCGVGAFLRGENWAWAPGWPAGMRVAWVFASNPDAPAVLPAPLPMVMDRLEGCLVCHSGVSGLGDAHRPEAVGCASCHGGDVFTLDKRRAHAGMEVVAGNLAGARRRCGQSACHPSIVTRVERSVMTTMSGVVAVNREVFGESRSVPAHVARLGQTPADTHLRQLCASCHVGREKATLGPNGESARGGGCNACHLAYSPQASAALERYAAEKRRGGAKALAVHPSVSLDIANTQCFGCHSRSGRISTNYEGWHELHEPPEGAADPFRPSPSRFRVLEDERVFERVTPDVHQQRGLDCIDCHTSAEAMGDGVAHARKSGQLRVVCEDCHAAPSAAIPSAPASALDPESRKILAVRKRPSTSGVEYGRARSGEILLDVVKGTDGVVALVRKRTGERRELRAAAPVCVEGRGHARLSCGSCHTSWAPRCPTCHTSYDRAAEAYDWLDDVDVKGGWKEKAGPFAATLPTLGVRRVPPAGGRGEREVVETFAPGMILTIEGRTPPAGPVPQLFRRLYARVEPHTTRREARSCTSCHNDPVALGYGQGDLRYDVTPTGGRWRFTPTMPRLPQDGLPADAWIPFLGERRGTVSTRDDVRPFTPDEQRKILRVGSCLICHAADSPVIRDSVRDFDSLVARRSRRCALPAW